MSPVDNPHSLWIWPDLFGASSAELSIVETPLKMGGFALNHARSPHGPQGYPHDAVDERLCDPAPLMQPASMPRGLAPLSQCIDELRTELEARRNDQKREG